MGIIVIESEWRETPIACPRCAGIMYSDGKHLPTCANPDCLIQLTLVDVLEWLITEHDEDGNNG